MSKEKYSVVESENAYYIADNEEDVLLNVAVVVNRLNDYEHRLSNCIEPKFKVGQEVWHCFKNCNEPDKTIIDWIDVEITENFIDFTYYDIDGFGFDEIMLFTTEAEAKKHLEELKK